MKYKRVLLKLSGEALSGKQGHGIDPEILKIFSNELKALNQMGTEVAVVIGGGNIHRGVSGSTKGMDRTTSDHMGMMAAVINALAMQDALEREGIKTRVLTAIEINRIAEFYYGFPEYLLKDVKELIPKNAGIIVFYRYPYGKVVRARTIRKAKRIKGCRKLTLEEQLRIAHLGTMRAWGLKKKLNKR